MPANFGAMPRVLGKIGIEAFIVQVSLMDKAGFSVAAPMAITLSQPHVMPVCSLSKQTEGCLAFSVILPFTFPTSTQSSSMKAR